MSVLVLGAGKMVDAILTGLKASQDLTQWQIYSPSGVSAAKLAEKVGAQHCKNLDELPPPSWILVGCKPQQLRELTTTLSGRFQQVLYVSLLAALPEESQRNILAVERLIRLMPGLAVEFNEGVSLLCSTSAQAQLEEFQQIFSRLGTSLIVSEQELDELTLLTGSGPALFYEFSKNLFESFESLDEAKREALVRQVLTGVGVSVRRSGESLGDLIGNVTSKGGVTIAVLEHWRAGGLKGMITQGIRAGRKRSQQIKNSIQG
ncbi:MAG TPA: pyrroline-5-carboxylate reductase dimerization domain-containing protein [Bacteriovoracaceae bacterium]|nr:pyrroline-5-carboxylate reductase dimerization domain-containing protein [Bacteriovoracaceae bacterium]